MDVFFGIIIVIVFLLVVLGPVLRRWLGPVLQRWVMGKMEDNMRRMAGMPTRKEERKARKEERKHARQEAGGRRSAEEFIRRATGARRGDRRRGATRSTIGLLRAVAEDVEYTEIKEFGESHTIGHAEQIKYKEESQVEDADFEEIRERK